MDKVSGVVGVRTTETGDYVAISHDDDNLTEPMGSLNIGGRSLALTANSRVFIAAETTARTMGWARDGGLLKLE